MTEFEKNYYLCGFYYSIVCNLISFYFLVFSLLGTLGTLHREEAKKCVYRTLFNKQLASHAAHIPDISLNLK